MSEENQNAEGQQALTQEQKDEAAAEKFRAQQQPPANENGGDADDDAGSAPQRPEHIPEKFWDAEKGEVRVEELAKSYAELEKAKANPPAKTEGEANPDDANLPEEVVKFKTEVTDGITSARAAMTEKLTAGLPLEDADYAPFERIGVTREDIDFIVEGMKAMGAQAQAVMHKEVGGEEPYKAMQEWARANLSADEIAAYNRDVVQSNDRNVNLNAVRGLFARYQLANGRSSRDVTFNGDRHGSVSGYQSRAEMVADMGSEKYKKDPSFRAQVASKVKASREAGVDLSQ